MFCFLFCFLLVIKLLADSRQSLRIIGEAVLTSTYNLCFEQKYVKYQRFLSETFQFLEVKFSIYLNRHVFVMIVYYLLAV